MLAGTIGTKGGPVTDATGTVLTEAGDPDRGLYAVGNAAGRRFTNEASPYDEVGKAMHRADDGGGQNDPAFLIFDEEFTRRYSLPGFSSGAVPAWLE